MKNDELEEVQSNTEGQVELKAEQSEDLEDFESESEDSLTYSNGVIEKIVAIALMSVPGVFTISEAWYSRVQDVFGAKEGRSGVKVEVTPDASVRVNISIMIEYGAYAPQIFDDVKKAVIEQVNAMTGLSVAGINLRIEDVLTTKEADERRRRYSDLPEDSGSNSGE